MRFWCHSPARLAHSKPKGGIVKMPRLLVSISFLFPNLSIYLFAITLRLLFVLRFKSFHTKFQIFPLNFPDFPTNRLNSMGNYVGILKFKHAFTMSSVSIRDTLKEQGTIA